MLTVRAIAHIQQDTEWASGPARAPVPHSTAVTRRDLKNVTQSAEKLRGLTSLMCITHVNSGMCYSRTNVYIYIYVQGPRTRAWVVICSEGAGERPAARAGRERKLQVGDEPRVDRVILCRTRKTMTIWRWQLRSSSRGRSGRGGTPGPAPRCVFCPAGAGGAAGGSCSELSLSLSSPPAGRSPVASVSVLAGVKHAHQCKTRASPFHVGT